LAQVTSQPTDDGAVAKAGSLLERQNTGEPLKLLCRWIMRSWR
jgi:hypothetical protein